MTCTAPSCAKPQHRAGLCQMHHWRLRTYGDVNHVREVRLCSFDGCTAKHKGHGLCQFHLKRKMRGQPMSGPLKTLNPKRYKMVTLPDHPLAGKNGRVALHRVALFDQIGFMIVPCYWCAAPLQFGVNLHVDHFDHDRHHNEPDNLLASCNSCNAGRMVVSKGREPMFYLEVTT